MEDSGTSKSLAETMRPIDSSIDRWVEHGWEAGALGLGAIKSLLRVERIYGGLVEQSLVDFNLSANQYEILMRLYYEETGSALLGRLSQSLQLSPASITNNVDRLEAAGLLSRELTPSDRRQVLAVLTDEGRSVASQATERMIETIFAKTGLTDAELRQLIELTSKLYAEFKRTDHD